MKNFYLLEPALKDNLWGGTKLKKYGKDNGGAVIAESWEISERPEGPSLTEDGSTIAEALGADGLGANVKDFEFFPVLVKLIDSASDLSVQVHPSDAYALANENQYGKTEMWYILEADEGCGIYLGFRDEVKKEDFVKSVNDGTVLDLLNFIEVRPGEVYFIPSGTVHAIGRGVTLCEIQQNSNLTYRIYDYKRKDKDGKERQLHVGKALDVTDFGKFVPRAFRSDGGKNAMNIIGANRYFTAFAVDLDGSFSFFADANTFTGITCLDGQYEVGGVTVKKGRSSVVAAGTDKYVLKGRAKLMIVQIRKYYIGIDLGGTFIKGGIVDDAGNIVARDKVPTESGLGAERVMDNISRLIELLVGKTTLSKEDIEGVGMGVPGMIDSKSGKVIFSNNLDWKDVSIAEGVSRRSGFKVKIANDANVAALGESKFGVGNSYDDCILLTLGTGVGGGIIVGNKLVEGNKSAGAELGHMVIKYGGEQCTCGRKGCLEAYSSATALIRDTKRAMIAHKDSKMWNVGDLNAVDGKTAFDYKDSDVYAKEVVDNYIEMLGCGIANIANIFRPHAVMLGGGVCAQGDNLIKPLQEVVDREIFAGRLGPQCPVFIAKLGNTAGLLGAAALLMENN